MISLPFFRNRKLLEYIMSKKNTLENKNIIDYNLDFEQVYAKTESVLQNVCYN